MTLTRETVEAITDLIENKLDMMHIGDRDDLREMVTLKHALSELRGTDNAMLAAGGGIPRQTFTFLTQFPDGEIQLRPDPRNGGRARTRARHQGPPVCRRLGSGTRRRKAFAPARGAAIGSRGGAAFVAAVIG